MIKLIIIYILNILDLIFTKHWVNKFGLEIEANPIGKWFLATELRQVVFKVIIPAVGLVILYIYRNNTWANIGSWILLIAYVLLIIYHIVIFYIAK